MQEKQPETKRVICDDANVESVEGKVDVGEVSQPVYFLPKPPREGGDLGQFL